METIHAANAELVQRQSIVAVFAGGSGGIGALSLKALASTVGKTEGKGLRAYIVSRNNTAAQEVIVECRELCPLGQYYFISIDDYALVHDVDAACEELMQIEGRNAGLANEKARIDYLMLSHGGPLFLPRQDTKEGIDGTMARFYYSRMASITKLLPLLLESSCPATVVSVYAAGMEGKLYADDLSLRQPTHYSYSKARSHINYMHTCFFEELAKRHNGRLRLIHIFPGLVVHKGMYSKENPWYLRLMFTKILPFFGVDMDPEEVGHRMVGLASTKEYPALPRGETAVSKTAIKGTDGELGCGVYALNAKGESAYPEKAYASLDKQGLKDKVWDHTNLALKQIRAGGVFEG